MAVRARLRWQPNPKSRDGRRRGTEEAAEWSTVAMSSFASTFALAAAVINIMLQTSDAFIPAAIRDCNFTECHWSGCPSTDPFLCTSTAVGSPFLGCSATPWKGICPGCCSIAACAQQKPSKGTPTCLKAQCSDEECKVGQQCGLAAPSNVLRVHLGSAAPQTSTNGRSSRRRPSALRAAT